MSPLERAAAFLLASLRSLSFSEILKRCFPGEERHRTRVWFVDVYIIVTSLLLVGCLFGNPRSPLSCGVAIYVMAEILVRTLGVIFVDRYSEDIWSSQRSILALFIGYIEVIVGCAILYQYFDCIEFCKDQPPAITARHALYFSTVTITTLGYGDIGPSNETGRTIVIVETLVGIVMIVYVLSIFLLSSSKLSIHGEKQAEKNTSTHKDHTKSRAE